MRVTRPYLLCLIMACSVVVACEQRPADPALPVLEPHWETIQRFDSELSAESIWASTADDVYVGWPSIEVHGDLVFGGRARIEHFDGSSWAAIPLPLDDEYGRTSLWGSGADNVYAALEHLYHFDGTAWRQEPIDAGLVSGAAPDNVYAANCGTIFHFDGAAWDTLLADTPGCVQSLAAAPDGSLFAGFYSDILRWDGATWVGTSWTSPSSTPVLLAFSAQDAMLVQVRRISSYSRKSDIYRWNGAQWLLEATIPGALQALSGESPADVFAVGDDGLVAHRDGAGWSVLSRPTGFALQAAGSFGPQALVAAGEGGKVMVYEAGTWTVLREGKIRDASIVWAESTSRLLVANYGLVFELNGNRWSERVLPRSTEVAAFGGRSLDDVYASTYDGSIFHYDGGAWTVAIDSVAHDLRALWMSPSGVLFTAGFGGVGRLDGTWESILDDDVYFNVLSGAGEGRLLAAGRRAGGRAVIMYLDGASWAELLPPVVYYDITGAWLGPDGDIYVANESALYRWDGARFERLTPPVGGRFTAVFGVSGSRVVALGSHTAIFDGTLTNVVQDEGHHQVAQGRDGYLISIGRSGLVAWRP
ncbi:MAG TPA: hypothetical protein VFX92_02045 [Candidatus Krumholzibacteria bacterium]|nr:hypothetical protein [Candidatus Krumholzibacteria bacterium]